MCEPSLHLGFDLEKQMKQQDDDILRRARALFDQGFKTSAPKPIVERPPFHERTHERGGERQQKRKEHAQHAEARHFVALA